MMLKTLLEEPAFVLMLVANLGVLFLIIAVRLCFALLPLRVNYYASSPREGSRFTLAVILLIVGILAGILLTMIFLMRN
jgi:hypothetical protein